MSGWGKVAAGIIAGLAAEGISSSPADEARARAVARGVQLWADMQPAPKPLTKLETDQDLIFGSAGQYTVRYSSSSGGFEIRYGSAARLRMVEGAAVKLLGNSGLSIRNAADSAAAALSCGALTASTLAGNGAGITSLDPTHISAGKANIDIAGRAETAGVADSALAVAAGGVTGIIAGRVVLGNGNSGLTSDAALTFSGGTLSATALKATGLSSGYFPIAGTGGLLADSALRAVSSNGFTVLGLNCDPTPPYSLTATGVAPGFYFVKGSLAAVTQSFNCIIDGNNNIILNDTGGRGFTIYGQADSAAVRAVGNLFHSGRRYAENGFTANTFWTGAWGDATDELNYIARFCTGYTVISPMAQVTVRNDCRMDIKPGRTTTDALVITSPAAYSADYWRAVDSGAATVAKLTSTGLLRAGRSFITPEGGHGTVLIAGEALAKGTVVKPSGVAADTAIVCALDEYDPIGIVYADAAQGAEVYVVTDGRCQVLVDGNATYENWLGVSGTNAGYATPQPIPAGNVQLHFRELGHCIGTANAMGLCWCMFHKL